MGPNPQFRMDCSHLLKKYVMKNFILCAVVTIIMFLLLHRLRLTGFIVAMFKVNFLLVFKNKLSKHCI